MALEIKQTLKLSQQLVMTPQLQQAIKLLQLNRLELSEHVTQEMLENPILEENPEFVEEEIDKVEQKKEKAEDDKTKEIKGEGEGVEEFNWENYIQPYSPPFYRQESSQDQELPSFEANLTKKTTLFEHLKWQLALSKLNEQEETIGMFIIGNIDEDGYLKLPLEEVAQKANAELELVEKILKKIQEFDPIGVAARDLTECLCIQAKQARDPETIRKVIKNHLKDLERKNYAVISRGMGISQERVQSLVKIISSMEPKPGRPFYDESAQYISPDIYIYKVGNEFIIVLNEDGLPKLKISNFYQNALKRGSTSSQEKEYINDKLRSAIWLIRSIHQRQRTIFKVTESIIKFQRDFLDKGIGNLKPMVLRDVAEDIGMHESTVSRVTTNKYVHTPQGIYELKFFFNSSIKRTQGTDIASESVKEKIKVIVGSEEPKKPYSDQEIVELLRRDNIEIARRTITKYREILGILPSSKRKRYF
jgi:RNA polymerase sigma-54 factor